MVAKVMIENGYKPGKGIGHSLQGMANPIGAEKNGDRFGLGYKPTRKDKERIAAEKREIRLAKLEGRDPAIPGLGEVSHISVTFPKPAYVYQPQALLTALAEDDPEADLLVEHLNRALSYTELKEVFDYDHIPDDVMQWALAQTVQVATIQAPAAPLINATIHPATLSERVLGWEVTPIPSRKLGDSG